MRGQSGTTEYPEPLCPSMDVIQARDDFKSHLGRRYSPVTAHTGSCARPSPSHRLVFLVRRVFAGCHQSLLGVGPSRHYLCNPCVGAWTHTPPCPPGASAHFFPESNGLTPRETRSAHETIPAMRFPQGAVFRGCSHSLMFRLLHSLGLQVAPTAKHTARGGQAVYTTHRPEGLPLPGCGITTRPSRATDAAGLAPAGLQPCRLLLPASGSPSDSQAFAFAWNAFCSVRTEFGRVDRLIVNLCGSCRFVRSF